MFAITGLIPGSDLFGISDSGQMSVKRMLTTGTATRYTVRPDVDSSVNSSCADDGRTW